MRINKFEADLASINSITATQDRLDGLFSARINFGKMSDLSIWSESDFADSNVKGKQV